MFLGSLALVAIALAQATFGSPTPTPLISPARAKTAIAFSERVVRPHGKDDRLESRDQYAPSILRRQVKVTDACLVPG